MLIDGHLRPILGAILATLLFLGGCAQVTGALQDVSDGLSQLMGDGSTPAQAAAPAERAGPEEGVSQNAEEARTQKPQDGVYRQALSARAKGANKKAFKGFLEAAGKRHPAAAYETARAYLDGRGVKVDQDKGIAWMRRATAYGEARAQFYMGQAYNTGEIVEQDETKAAALFTEAAVQGHAEAQYALGETYSAGRGVPKNPPWAARWYGKAAHQGLREAQYAYGLVHARGLGLSIDRTKGYRWLLLAARAGHERAEVVRRALQTKMAQEMVDLAETWAARFRQTPEPSFADRPTVMYVQQVLNDLGFEAGPVDGKPGKRTGNAVKSYLKKSGQPRSRKISPQLVNRLLAEQAKAP